jgi:hypothetical protein
MFNFLKKIIKKDKEEDFDYDTWFKSMEPIIRQTARQFPSEAELAEKARKEEERQRIIAQQNDPIASLHGMTSEEFRQMIREIADKAEIRTKAILEAREKGEATEDTPQSEPQGHGKRQVGNPLF